MFALLEHTTSDGRHWDLLIEAPGHSGLVTWRLADDPRQRACVAAERLPDHRRVYLDFEGDIGGGRGVVRRVERGVCEILAADAGGWRLRLEGASWRGEFALRADDAGSWTLRRESA